LSGYRLGGVWHAYFVERHRHLPELVFFLLGAWLYWCNRTRIADRTGLRLALTVGVLMFIQPHGNVTYALYAMPFLLWVMLEAYERAPKWRWVPALVFIGILLQYAYLYRINLHEGFEQEDYAVVRERISESESALGIADSQLKLCGDYSLWFAHPEKYQTCPILWQEDSLRNANLFLCFDGPLEPGGLSATTSMSCSEINEVVPLREMSSLTIRGHLLHVDGRR
jgi:hypothetical protein